VVRREDASGLVEVLTEALARIREIAAEAVGQVTAEPAVKMPALRPAMQDVLRISSAALREE
jgi:hypothetical protein